MADPDPKMRIDPDQKMLQQMGEQLWKLARTYDVSWESLANALVSVDMAPDLDERQQVGFSLADASISPTPAIYYPMDDVILSRDQAARLFDMTPQSISWHVKHGNLKGVKVRVNGRSRLGIPLRSLCDYFEIAPERRARVLALLLDHIGDGSLRTVFWDVPEEGTDEGPFSELAALLNDGVVRNALT
ncbi:MAG: hypothetical protein OXG19_09630 [Chloroflexi bacterium]|nr:hypothetical protein [Chloroflexota bacterium]